MVSSLNIADVFGKAHHNVVRSICNLMNDLETVSGGCNSNELNFELVEYKDAKGEMRTSYQMNRDAFSLLVMGFTGKRALEWKLKYIQAFNMMEAELKAPSQAQPAQIAISATLLAAHQIIALLNEICEDAEDTKGLGYNAHEVLRERCSNVQATAAQITLVMGVPHTPFRGALIPKAAHDIITGRVAYENKPVSPEALRQRKCRELQKQKQLEAA